MATRFYFRPIASIFAFLLLFNSCRVYKHNSSTLEEAVQSERRVKIKTINDSTLKFQKVIYEDGMFYGINLKNGEITKTVLKPEELTKVRLHNKALSIVYNVLLGLGVSLFIAYVLVMEAVSDLRLD